MAAKDKGLHTGSEMSEGQGFTLEFRILNPKPNDIRIMSLWKRDINNGFIRFGGLTSQGRGKVSITDEHDALFTAQQTALAKEIRKDQYGAYKFIGSGFRGRKFYVHQNPANCIEYYEQTLP